MEIERLLLQYRLPPFEFSLAGGIYHKSISLFSFGILSICVVSEADLPRDLTAARGSAEELTVLYLEVTSLFPTPDSSFKILVMVPVIYFLQPLLASFADHRSSSATLAEGTAMFMSGSAKTRKAHHALEHESSGL